MTFHIFECSTQPNLFAATEDAAGAQLPKDVCPHAGTWTPQRQLQESEPGFSAEAATAAISSQGYYLFSVTQNAGITMGNSSERDP